MRHFQQVFFFQRNNRGYPLYLKQLDNSFIKLIYNLLFCRPQAMTVIIRDFKQYTVTEKHLQALLGFVEEDIHDHTKQGTAFPLLKVRLMIILYASENYF